MVNAEVSGGGLSGGSAIDWVAIAEVLTIGEAFGDDRPVVDEVTSRSVPSRSRPQPGSFLGSREEALDRCDDLVREGIAQTPSDWQFSMGLSGGHDSRHLLVAAEAEGRPVRRAVCAEHWTLARSAADSAAANALADRLGMPLEIAPRDVIAMPRSGIRTSR